MIGPNLEPSIRISKFTNFLVGAVALFAVLYYGKSLLVPLFSSLILSFALHSVVVRLQKFGLHPLLAITFALIGVATVISAIIFLIGAQLNSFLKELPGLIKSLEVLLTETQAFVEKRLALDPENQFDILRDGIVQLFSTGTFIVRSTITTTSNILFYLALIPVYVFFMIYYRQIYYNFVMEIAPEGQKELAQTIVDKLKDVIQSYIGGITTIIIIIAFLNTVGLLLLGIKYAVFFGVFTALLSIIPYFGVLIGASFTFLYVLLTSASFWTPVGVIIIYSIVQFLEGNFITPYVMGSKVQLNPLAVLVSLLIGGTVWGAAGLILAVPAIAITKMIFDNIDYLKPYGKVLGTKA